MGKSKIVAANIQLQGKTHAAFTPHQTLIYGLLSHADRLATSWPGHAITVNVVLDGQKYVQISDTGHAVLRQLAIFWKALCEGRFR